MERKQAIEQGALLAQATSRANADPLPGPLAKAFGPSVVMVGEIAVRKPVASDWEIFRQLDSPILRILMDLRQNPDVTPEIEPTPEEEYEICWQFTHTPAECRALIVKGRESFRKTSVEDIGDRWTGPDVKLVQTIVINKIAEASTTALKYAAELEEKGEVTFFRDSGATRKTDLDGSLNTQPASVEILAGAIPL